MKAPCEIGEHGSRFVIGMRSNVEDASGYSSVFDGFDGFREAWTGARGGRKLCLGWRRENQGKEK